MNSYLSKWDRQSNITNNENFYGKIKAKSQNIENYFNRLYHEGNYNILPVYENEKINILLRSTYPEILQKIPQCHNIIIYENLIKSLILSPEFIYKYIYIFLDYGFDKILIKYSKPVTTKDKKIKRRILHFLKIYWSIPELNRYRYLILDLYPNTRMHKYYFKYMFNLGDPELYYNDILIQIILDKEKEWSIKVLKTFNQLVYYLTMKNYIINNRTYKYFNIEEDQAEKINIFINKINNIEKIDPSISSYIIKKKREIKYQLMSTNSFTKIDFHLKIIKIGCYIYIEDYLSNDIFLPVVEYIIDNYLDFILGNDYQAIKKKYISELFNINLFSICYRRSAYKKCILDKIINSSYIFDQDEKTVKYILSAIFRNLETNEKQIFYDRLREKYINKINTNDNKILNQQKNIKRLMKWIKKTFVCNGFNYTNYIT